ncbi:MAG TPA: PadR family transcriptional regulator [Solirubrobacteraceae bacterium]|jgi:DNA-binding PadR family transcriptional regulator|nr:PadR family transcriptional regulator [Solirubrobacteraceae bacterium]
MERKPIRLTTTSYAVLCLLDLAGEATPYELKQMLVNSIEHFWPVPHTTFYDEPARLAKAGYLSESQEQRGRRRKRYSLTELGHDALRAWADAPGAPPSQYRDEAMLKVFAGADPEAAFAGRIEWHRAQLAELEGYLANLKEGHTGRRADEWRGPEITVLGGIEYHRQMIGIFERFAAAIGREAQALAANGGAATADPTSG